MTGSLVSICLAIIDCMSHYTMLCKCGRVILRGRFNETIFLLAFVGSGMILANYALRAPLAIYYLINNKHSQRGA